MRFKDEKQVEKDLQEYARLLSVSFAVGLVGFDFNFWLLLKLPLLVSGTLTLYAIALYLVRK